MITGLRTFLLLLFIAFTWQTAHADSPLVQYPGNGHYYQRFDTFKYWTDARDYCQSVNGHLATITSRSEDDFVNQNLVQNLAQPGAPVLLGGTDRISEGTWQWITGEAWSYADWAPGQPDNNNEQDYLAYWNNPTYPGQWDDSYGGVLLPFICEWNWLTDVWPTDLTDIWWNPNEAGWGMNLVQTGSFVYVTIYVYGADGKPTWFGGGLDKTGAGTLTGKLYAATGPYFGGPFDPNAWVVREVGTMTFVATTGDTGQFTYSVDGVPVNKAVQRQPLTLDNYNGTYESIEILHVTDCSNPAANGDDTNQHTVLITQNGSAMAVTFGTLGLPGGSCTATGTYSQLGRMGHFVGPYACPWGETGVYALSQMNHDYRQFSARISKNSANTGCKAVGQTTGLIEY